MKWSIERGILQEKEHLPNLSIPRLNMQSKKNHNITFGFILADGKQVVSTFFLICLLSTAAAQENLEQLFDKREYNEIITQLSEKYEKNTLSLEEHYGLTRSYGRTRQ